MKKLMMVVAIVMAIVLTPATAYSAELKSLQDELYDDAMDELFYENQEHEIEYHGYFNKKKSSSIEYTVIGEKYYAMIYYNYESDVYYGTIYTKMGNFVENLKDDDAYNIMSDMY